MAVRLFWRTLVIQSLVFGLGIAGMIIFAIHMDLEDLNAGAKKEQLITTLVTAHCGKIILGLLIYNAFAYWFSCERDYKAEAEISARTISDKHID